MDAKLGDKEFEESVSTKINGLSKGKNSLLLKAFNILMCITSPQKEYIVCSTCKNHLTLKSPFYQISYVSMEHVF